MNCINLGRTAGGENGKCRLVSASSVDNDLETIREAIFAPKSRTSSSSSTNASHKAKYIPSSAGDVGSFDEYFQTDPKKPSMEWMAAERVDSSCLILATLAKLEYQIFQLTV